MHNAILSWGQLRFSKRASPSTTATHDTQLNDDLYGFLLIDMIHFQSFEIMIIREVLYEIMSISLNSMRMIRRAVLSATRGVWLRYGLIDYFLSHPKHPQHFQLRYRLVYS